MNAVVAGPTPAERKSWAAEAGQWLWGTVQGAFNEKQSLSQIIVDAVIGMIPLLGDATAARDLIAVGTALGTNPEKREKASEWVLFAILIFALIPVAGGAIKGVGRIALRVTEDAAKDSRAIVKLANEIIEFLNRIGHKNAEAWFKALDVMTYEGKLIEKCKAFCDTVILCINRYALRFKAVLPQSLLSRMEQMSQAFQKIKDLANKMIPDALKNVNARLKKLQQYIHAGGVPPPEKALIYEAQTGKKTLTYADEARLIENGAKNIVHAGKYPQNIASTDPASALDLAKVYKHEPGYPNLLGSKLTDEETGVEYYPAVAAASGPIKNEELSGTTLYRSFGDRGTTHGVDVSPTNPVGFWWGIGQPPKTAEEWRQKAAVLDEFNRNGKICIINIPDTVKIKACTSTVSEQFGKKIPGQYLEGGGKQAAITEFFGTDIQKTIDDLRKLGGGKKTLPNGIAIEVRDSGWSKINGKIGYGQTVIPGAATTERLGVTEMQTKVGTAAAQQTASQAASQGTVAIAKQKNNEANQVPKHGNN